MLRLAALLLASTLLVPMAASAPPTVQSYRSFTASQFEAIAADILAIPEVAAGLPDGSLLRFVVKPGSGSGAPQSFQGVVSGTSAPLSSGSGGDAALQLTAYDSFWGSIANACDRANTAKLGIRDGYVGIDGSSAAKAAANGLKTGRFDAQLAAQRPTAGQAFPCQGYSPTLIAVSYRLEASNQIASETILVGTLDGRDYVINDMGAVEGQRPLAKWGALATTTSLSHFIGGSTGTGVSLGISEVPTACKNVDTSTSIVKAYFIALCMKRERASGVVS